MRGSEVVVGKSLGVIADSGPGAHVVPHLRHLSERNLHHHVIWYMLCFEGISTAISYIVRFEMLWSFTLIQSFEVIQCLEDEDLDLFTATECISIKLLTI